MTFKSNDIAWIPPIKGDYCPPPQDIYKNLICRKIKTSNYIDRHISHFIGKDGRQFIEWTNQFDVLYIFYRDRQIEVWGEDPTNVHSAIHFIIEKIKKMNQKRQERYEKFNTKEQQQESLPDSSQHVSLTIANEQECLPDSSEHVSLTIASEQECLPDSTEHVSLTIASEQECLPDSSEHVSLTIASEQECLPDSSEHVSLTIASEQECLPNSSEHKAVPTSSEEEG